MLHIIDSVLEPLIPISIKDAEYFVHLDAFKLLSKSSLYDLDGLRTRVFKQQADINRNTHMFGVEGRVLIIDLKCINNQINFRSTYFLHPCRFCI